MGLDDRERRILQEIERQFYEEDPDLADAVRNISRIPMTAGRMRLAILGAVFGLIFLLATFQRSTILAALGFLVFVFSSFFVVQGKRILPSDRAPQRADHLDDL